ncbi:MULTISPECIES: Sec-independent protein translocase protein TatB [Nitrosomonas]|uniref:Sec-independent protein translocase protein TatB n=1 Tax=Nitrosomonas TaxID=914 RepID=UPI0019378875|nr:MULTISPECIES: Sec-independent protein translocase protein TatB [Nitrosomonas]QOJ09121.1 MAG: twin-arginine translocase subunit TatB [Nitrosomonas sp. H1_AOB3]HNR10585.1 Sec-independent protein translocase protein TatB [Nitrosomonas europaea]HNS57949.1 Sec-independent protein translocase protein TatB [Nitrosomonas europaea]HRO56571.1 Sec-independent protein translocase protein TatB [Nitrosomonas europaea]HUM74133.1 Sec-independent protein translocase protein TatB [Nitrosomonas europaea]
MFDISFAELVVVGIVALIVIGPERLPTVARTVGYFLGRARRYVDQVKHDLHEEMELDSLRKLRDSMHETVNSFENSVRSEINKIQETTETQSAVIPDKQPPFEKAAENIEPVNTSETKTSSAPAEPRQPNS